MTARPLPSDRPGLERSLRYARAAQRRAIRADDAAALARAIARTEIVVEGLVMAISRNGHNAPTEAGFAAALAAWAACEAGCRDRAAGRGDCRDSCRRAGEAAGRG